MAEDVRKVLAGPDGACDSGNNNIRNNNNNLLKLTLTKSVAANTLVAVRWGSVGDAKAFAATFLAPLTCPSRRAAARVCPRAQRLDVELKS